jgi:hypothetical protein
MVTPNILEPIRLRRREDSGPGPKQREPPVADVVIECSFEDDEPKCPVCQQQNAGHRPTKAASSQNRIGDRRENVFLRASAWWAPGTQNPKGTSTNRPHENRLTAGQVFRAGGRLSSEEIVQIRRATQDAAIQWTTMAIGREINVKHLAQQQLPSLATQCRHWSHDADSLA